MAPGTRLRKTFTSVISFIRFDGVHDQAMARTSGTMELDKLKMMENTIEI